MPTVELVDDPSIKASCRPLKALQQEVTKVYFAEREEKETFVENPNGSEEKVVKEHVTKSAETLPKIAKIYGVPESQLERTKSGKPYLFIGEIIKVKKKGDLKKEVSFKEITSGTLNGDVYLIAETKNLRDEKMLFNILQGQEDCFAKANKPITVQQDDKDVSLIETIVGGYCDDDEIENKDDFADWAIAKIKLAPKNEDKLKEWTDGLDCVASNKALLYVLADAHSEHSMTDFESKYIKYHGFKGVEDDSRVPNHFMNEKGKWFEVGQSNCFCNRDLTVAEGEDIIKKLRESEKISSVDLFTASNCKIPAGDKTIEKFTEELNKTFNEYEINTCARKIHFLAQIYHETDRLRTTKEYSTSGSYKPYFGRGLMQLTWKSNYQMYEAYSGVGCVADYELISNDLHNAFDSAGWFWKQGKKLSVGKTWKAPSGAPSYVKVHSPSYPKDTIEYTVDGTTKKYGTVDMNLIADNDTEDVISWLVNGGGNGLKERQKYVKTLKEIFEYPGECVGSGGAVDSTSEDGVLEKMKKIVDKHIPYSQSGERVADSDIGWAELDCSELVMRYLYELGAMTKLKMLYTSEMTTQAKFRKLMGTDNIELVSGSTGKDFKPQAGDIFVWRKSSGGHTGIVYEYDEDKDLVTILEAIGSSGSRDSATNRSNGGYTVNGVTRTSVYKRAGSALNQHDGWKGYFRPINYTKQL